MELTRLIQSTSARRLMLVVVLFALGLVVLGAQTARLTVLKGDTLYEEAEERLIHLSWHPTVRGSIRDRKGVILAHDRASFDLAVEYSVLTGEWVERQAARRARRDHGEEWGKLSRERRLRLIEEAAPPYRAAVDRMWNVVAERTGRSRAEIDARRFKVIEEVRRLGASVRRRRAIDELHAFAENHGITDDELEARIAALDRPDLETNEEILRAVLAEEITIDAERRIDKSANIRILEERTPRVIVHQIGDDVGFELRKLMTRRDPADDSIPYLPGLDVVESHERAYPMLDMSVPIDLSQFPGLLSRNEIRDVRVENVARLILGDVRHEVFKEDSDARDEKVDNDPAFAERVHIQTPAGERDRGGYVQGDAVGRFGLERSYEHTLRGLRGVTIERVDRNETTALPHDRGQDLALTLDIHLQARIQALLDPTLGLTRVQPWHRNQERLDPDDANSPLLMPVGTPMNAAAVVMDVATGDLLALVSTPTTPSSSASPEVRRRENAIRKHWVNRAVQSPLPPGSIVKALVLCGAHKAGLVNAEEHIECTGHFYEHATDMLRCWIYKQYGVTHGVIDGAEAVKHSCNIYFYSLGQRFGPAGIVDFFHSIGVGEDLNLGLDGEIAGWLGQQNNAASITEGEAILMGIGQGPVAWTPVHAASAFVALARMGQRVRPRMIEDGQAPDTVDLGFDPVIVDEALKGLRAVVADADGTAHHVTYGSGEQFLMFDVPDVTVWGKTGTATTSPLYYEGELVRRGDHSWFVLLCGRETPEYAIAVVVEYGGSGGRVSGPIANQIVRALVHEGYL